MDRGSCQAICFSTLATGKGVGDGGAARTILATGAGSAPNPVLTSVLLPVLSIDPTTLASPIPPLHPTRTYESLARVRP